MSWCIRRAGVGKEIVFGFLSPWLLNAIQQTNLNPVQFFSYPYNSLMKIKSVVAGFVKDERFCFLLTEFKSHPTILYCPLEVKANFEQRCHFSSL
jgi:hypothetical protein